MDARPYYRRRSPEPQDPLLFEFDRIDLSQQPLPPYPQPDPQGRLPDSRPLANARLDYRAAAAVSASVGDPKAVRLAPPVGFSDPDALLETQVLRRRSAGHLHPHREVPRRHGLAGLFPGRASS